MGFYSAVWPLVDEPLADFRSDYPAHGFNPTTPIIKTSRSRPERDTGSGVEGAWPDVEQRLPNRRGGTGLLGGQSFPLWPAEVQHEQHTSMLRLRGRFAGMVVLLQQQSFAG